MAKPQKSTAQSEVPGLVKKGPLYYLKRDWQLYALMLLPMVFIIVFKYFAYTGLSVAFLDYKIGKGYAGSKFVGLKIFEKVFKHRDFTKAVVNTLLLNVLDLIFSFPMPIILALLLNEIRVKWFKRTTQTLLYLPHFLSWVVIGAVAYQMFATQSGVVNALIANAGKSPIPFLQEDGWWLFSYVLIGVWQTMGWGTIIYLAAITNVNSELYEAAKVDGANQNLFTDWGSYDFTVSEKALDDFAAQYGYTLTAEDFINKGSLQVTHMPPTAHKRDYMEFTQQFVAGYGKKLVDLVHSYGKRAYVFYDDSWVGVEPYGPHFKEFGFDGVIKCVFSGYEARMCAGVDAPVHELRFHPYLFPVGLGGAPTFAPGGNPTRDAAEYWNHVRRALLRAKIDRIGLGGYLHLLNDFPDFVEYIADISDEFRAIKELHTHGAVATLPLTVAVLHSWGSLRPWTLSGHFHETYMHTLIHINEALAGLPVNVKFINFDNVKNGVPDDVDVIINAGRAGSAWSGGDAWQDETLVAALNKWVYNGGVLLGVEEPSAVSGYGDTFRMARILGVDEDTGARVCHGRWPVQAEPVDGLIPDGATLKTHDHLYMTDGGTRVLAEVDGTPAIAAHAFGKGRGVYMAGFEYSPVNARMLLNLLLWAKGLPLNSDWLTTDPETETAWFPADKTLVVINNSTQKKSTVVKTPDADIAVELDGLETKILPQN